jgi:hypothetical protein
LEQEKKEQVEEGLNEQTPLWHWGISLIGKMKDERNLGYY